MATHERSSNDTWPELPYKAWADTCSTLNMWTQIVGKVRMELSPPLNHLWHVTLYVTVEGLSTGTIPFGPRVFEIVFDLVRHELRIEVSDGARRAISLRPMTVAEFYRQVMAALAELGIEVTISAVPNEVAEAIPFASDTTHASYDADAVARFRQALLQVDRVLRVFRSRFRGKASPVHFFWGAFDLAATRFSGRPAPRHPGGVPNCPDYVMHEAYAAEVSSAGWWPGGGGVDEPMFYSYAYPQPDGFGERTVQPETAYYDATLGEFLLPYEAVRTARDPDAALLAFLQTTYEAAADLAGWDRGALEAHRTAVPGAPAGEG